MNSYDAYGNTRVRISNRKMNAFASAPRGFKMFFGFTVGLVALFFVGAIVMVTATVVSAQSPESVTCTVSSKERVTEVVDGNSQTRLLVNTEDCGTLEIGSALISGNWSPNQTYSNIQDGETYNFEVYGFNIDAMNQFKKIKSVEQVR